jgi:hypothetical protein
VLGRVDADQVEPPPLRNEDPELHSGHDPTLDPGPGYTP